MAERKINEVAVFSSLLSQIYDQSWYGKFSIKESDFFISYIGKSLTLEIGSGTGRLSIPLLERGCNIFGLEGSKSMYEKLQSKLFKKNKSRFIVWDAMQVPYPIANEFFENIIIPFSTFGLIHNNETDLGANRLFNEFYRILKLGGLVIINDFRTQRIDRERLNKDLIEESFYHYHSQHGEILEKQTSQLKICPNELLDGQIIRERNTVFSVKKTGQVLEEHFERIPLWDIGDFPILGQKSGFKYVKGEICPDFHEEPSIMHIFQKT
ncbi:MAG: class I SAM-dependent methyltransferase [Gammaproteobacteria bacterium]|nr:class I SAM-dependent methyltransferase [Gammaproteobacteria bacterium]